MTINKSGLKPKGVAVLVEPYEIQTTSRLVLPPAVKERMQTAETKVRVLAVGAAAWHDEPVPRAQPGDIVMITRFAGVMVVGKDDKPYRIVNDRDIFVGCEA